MTDNIADQTPKGQSFPEVKTVSGASPMTNPSQPKSEQVRRAAQWAAWSIRRKNRQAQSNNGRRVPLT